MRIKVDENLPSSLAAILRDLGHDADTVPEEKLSGTPDSAVWAVAQTERRFLITQDLDFSDLRRFEPGTHAGVMIVRLREPSRAALVARIRQLFEREDAERWAACFVLATDAKLRVRLPAR